MIITGINAMGMGLTGLEAKEDIDKESRDSILRLLNAPEGVYNREIARTLAFMSSWTYSDLGTLASVMSRRGLRGCDCAGIVATNDAMFLDTSAVIVQSPGRKLTILSFRGTQPRNAINWLTNVSAGTEAFMSGGNVHGGFHRAVRSVWPLLVELIQTTLIERSICKQLENIRGRYLSMCGASGAETPLPSPPAAVIPGEDAMQPALYITGHSLGGALAALAASLLYAYEDARLIDVRPNLSVKKWLRGVYTYGQPMVGDDLFARVNEELGKKVFRHVYRKDIVPRLPPLVMGNFVHFGQQYNSSEGGWVRGERPLQHVLSLGLSNIIGALAWFTQEVIPLRGIQLPFSWGDHAPVNYLRTSVASPHGAEFD